MELLQAEWQVAEDLMDAADREGIVARCGKVETLQLRHARKELHKHAGALLFGEVSRSANLRRQFSHKKACPSQKTL